MISAPHSLWSLGLILAVHGHLSAAAGVRLLWQPTDLVVVAGHQARFAFSADVYEPTVVWYRDGVEVASGADATLAFTAVSGDDGTRYHAVVSGFDKSSEPIGPTTTSTAILTVLPAGTAYPPAVTGPPDGSILPLNQHFDELGPTFTAQGNHLTWTYRYSNEPVGEWHVLPDLNRGLQQISDLLVLPPVPHPRETTMTVRVTDDAGVRAQRTWGIDIPNTAPVPFWDGSPKVCEPTFGPPFQVAYVGHVLRVGPEHGLRAFAHDAEGDELHFRLVTAIPGLLLADDGSFTYTPPAEAVPDHWYRVWLSDDGLSIGGGLSEPFSYVVSDGELEATHSFRVVVMTGPGDLDRDGVVNAADLDLVIGHFGESDTIPTP